MVLFFLSTVAIITATACDGEYFLTPESIDGDGSLHSNLLDGYYDSYWQGVITSNEEIYYHFSSEVQVKTIFIQRWADHLSWVSIFDGSSVITTQYWGAMAATWPYHGRDAIMNWKFKDVHTDYLRFTVLSDANPARIRRLEVYGCYSNTSTPTPAPTTGEPTQRPSSIPSVSPTLPPITSLPTKTPSTSPTAAPSMPPSTSPTTAPTMLPSTANPSLHPSESPSSSPTKSPSTAIPSPSPSEFPSSSPTKSPTFIHAGNDFQVTITIRERELLYIVILILFGVVFYILLRYRKMGSRMNTGEEVIEINSTRNVAGESTKTELMQVAMPNENGNICLCLDKVSSLNDGTLNLEGDGNTGL